jgi:GNAT superfamily N-acetyltransferase
LFRPAPRKFVTTYPPEEDVVRIRSARPSEALLVANVHVRSWQAGYAGLLPKEYLDGLRAEDRVTRYDFSSTAQDKAHTIVALNDESQVVGFATVRGNLNDDALDQGELNALYVDPLFWRLGIGSELISAARRLLLERGFQSAFLWLLDGNTRGERFYRNDGWLPDGETRSEILWGTFVSEVRYRRPQLR